MLEWLLEPVSQGLRLEESTHDDESLWQLQTFGHWLVFGHEAKHALRHVLHAQYVVNARKNMTYTPLTGQKSARKGWFWGSLAYKRICPWPPGGVPTGRVPPLLFQVPWLSSPYFFWPKSGFSALGQNGPPWPYLTMGPHTPPYNIYSNVNC